MPTPSYLAPLTEAGPAPSDPAQQADFEANRRRYAQWTEWIARFPAHEPLIALTVYNAYEDLVECLLSLISTVPGTVPIIAIDDNSPDPRVARLLEGLASTANLFWLRKLWNTGVVDSCELAFHYAGRRDVVILNSDIVLPADWLPRLRAAAYSNSRVASATPLSNNALLYSVPYRNRPIDGLPPGHSLEGIDQLIRANSLELFPSIPSAITFCTYIKRAALDVVGTYDMQFSPGYGEEVDWSQRAIIHGLDNVLADNVFVLHKGSKSFGVSAAKQALQDSHEAIIRRLYPWHGPNAADAMNRLESPLARSLAVASAAVLGLRVGIDATAMAPYVTGTQTAIAHFVARLRDSRPTGAQLTVIVADGFDIDRTDLLSSGLWHGVQVMSKTASLQTDTPIFDVIHRPCQVTHPDEVRWLHSLARRVIVSQLDCIAYNNPLYHQTYEAWSAYRLATEMVFETADGVFYNSREVLSQCRLAGLHIEDERGVVLANGTDHLARGIGQPATRELVARLAGRPFMLVLGTDFVHKNRHFALRVLRALVHDHGWAGCLVFAGPSVSDGSSRVLEKEILLRHPDLAGAVIELGSVSEADKLWLLKNAGLVLYPSSVEGFGFIPFEAAALGTAALTSADTVFPEVLGPHAAMYHDHDPAVVASIAHRLLQDPAAAAAQVAAIQARARIYRWDQVAATAWSFYTRTHRGPKRYIGAFAPRDAHGADQELAASQELRRLYSSRTYRLAVWFARVGRPLKPLLRPLVRAVRRLRRR